MLRQDVCKTVDEEPARETSLTVTNKASSVARLLKLQHFAIPLSTWMGDHQGKLGAVNLGPLVGMDLNLAV